MPVSISTAVWAIAHHSTRWLVLSLVSRNLSSRYYTHHAHFSTQHVQTSAAVSSHTANQCHLSCSENKYLTNQRCQSQCWLHSIHSVKNYFSNNLRQFHMVDLWPKLWLTRKKCAKKAEAKRDLMTVRTKLIVSNSYS